MGDADDALTVDKRLRPVEDLSTCTRVAFPIFAIIVPLVETILFGRLSSSTETPNVAVGVGEAGGRRVGSANGLPAALDSGPVSVPSSISPAVNAIWASGDRADVV